MTKPDFKQMTRKELKKYILSHPTDDEAIEEFIVNHRGTNTVVLPPPSTMSYEQVEAIFKEKIDLSQSEKLD
ncbi:hypothetical protein [Cyanothece sp. BG0011]|uniref:DUF6887 family protein n=1 Tax=Cyanothece sp. BG0011 TaxID=2082950 RepID=UPI000D1DDE63|nr:hypothetical protein [Cyanothece sp. BG0011]